LLHANNVVIKVAETHVAFVAKNPAHTIAAKVLLYIGAARMVMVNVKPMRTGVVCTADCALIHR
jgi:hypothetical protein